MHGRHGKSRSSRRERRDEFSFYFRDLYGEHLLLSERSLRGCIGFGGSAQAGEFPRRCCIGTGKFVDRQLIEHIFYFIFKPYRFISCSVGLVEVDLSEF